MCVLITGEVRYARNGHHVTTLMHVDTSLPLWAFLDIYGSMKEIKSIGKSAAPGSGCSVLLFFTWIIVRFEIIAGDRFVCMGDKHQKMTSYNIFSPCFCDILAMCCYS